MDESDIVLRDEVNIHLGNCSDSYNQKNDEDYQ
jgi:hypothetical protein